jgi:catechol 2,3-dioxygenase-like lactoylglutathione lyase family enzyme
VQIKRLSHVSLSSRNLAATERFYVGILGFKIAHEFRNPAGERYGFFLHVGGGSFLEFFQKLDAGREEGLFRHLCFETDNIEAVAEKLRTNGITNFTVKRGRTDRILQFFISDPDAIQVEFQQHDAESVLMPYVKGG